MKEFYQNIGIKRLYIIIAVLLLLGDITFGFITVDALGNYEQFKGKIMEALAQADTTNSSAEIQKIKDMPEEYLKQIFFMAQNMIYIMFALFGAFHFLVYIMLTKQKRFARVYCIALSFTAALSCILTAIFASPLYLIGLASYTFSFIGLLALAPDQKNQEL